MNVDDKLLSLADKKWLEQADAMIAQRVQHAFFCSEYLAKCCHAIPQLLSHLATGYRLPTNEREEHEAALGKALSVCESEADLMRTLRHYHQAEMATITWYDVVEQQSICDSLRQVSVLADTIITQASSWLFAHLSKRSGEPEHRQPLCIIAMGKLGGLELNFSSDVDLIFAYPNKGTTQGGRKPVEHQVFFTRLAQRLIHVLDTVTPEGRLYRVDMRLRPFGESGPLVSNFDSLENYYQEQAREWERFALTKGRILDTDNRYSKQLNAIILPFVYKGYLDFTTTESLRDIKQRINAEVRHRQLHNNVKLGRGGIREAEFFVQSFQMIHGGRTPKLQVKNWQQACALLAENRLISQQECDALTQAYLFLRKVEHALQQLRNEQTQTLPENSSDRSRIAASVGLDGWEELEARISAARETIYQMYAELFATPELNTPKLTPKKQWVVDIWQLELNEDEIRQASEPYVEKTVGSQLARTLLTFKSTTRSSQSSPRGRQQLDKLMPLLLENVLVETHASITVLERILALLAAILGRTTYLDLLLAYPNVRQQLVMLCTKSPWIAEQLAQFPLLLDELLAPNYQQPQEIDLEQYRRSYDNDLRQSLIRIDPDDDEHYMDALRQFKLCQQLRIAAADVTGTLPVEKVSDKLTVLAEVLLSETVRKSLSQMVTRYGAPTHLSDSENGFAAIAYGKMGGWELGYGSDLDLVFIHNTPRDIETSGPKVIDAQQFYSKVAQRILHLLNTTTRFGKVYEVDMRLRPSGNAGLLCCHINGFNHYQTHDAWTWEHQALVRARPVFGSSDIRRSFEQTRQTTLSQTREPNALQQDVADMRKKLYLHWQQSGSETQLKQGEGGIKDIEFLVQYWVLAYSDKVPELTTWQDNLRIVEVAVANNIIPEKTGETLKFAYLHIRNLLHHSTLAKEEPEISQTDLVQLRDRVFAIWLTTLPPYTVLE